MFPDTPGRLAARNTLCLAALAGAVWISGKVMRRIGNATRLTKPSHPYNASPPAPQARLLIVGDSTVPGTGASAPEASLAGQVAQRYPMLAIRNLASGGACFETIAEQFLYQSYA